MWSFLKNLFPENLFSRKIDPSAERRLRLAQARAEESIIRTHVDNALMFVDTLAEDLTFDRAIDSYIRLMSIPEPLASTVATRTLVVLGCGNLTAADAKAKRLLLVTDSGGFVHDSVGLAEQTLKEIGPKNGFEVTCYRYTRDPKDPAFVKYAENFRKVTGVTVEPESCGRVNKEALKNFDVVLFFTTGNPLTKEELVDLQDWVKAGGASRASSRPTRPGSSASRARRKTRTASRSGTRPTASSAARRSGAP